MRLIGVVLRDNRSSEAAVTAPSSRNSMLAPCPVPRQRELIGTHAASPSWLCGNRTKGMCWRSSSVVASFSVGHHRPLPPLHHAQIKSRWKVRFHFVAENAESLLLPRSGRWHSARHASDNRRPSLFKISTVIATPLAKWHREPRGLKSGTIANGD